MRGAPAVASGRVGRALSSMQLPDRTWRRLTADSPAGRCNLFVDKDKPPRQLRGELCLRRTKAVLQKELGLSIFLNRADLVAKCNFTDLLRFDPQPGGAVIVSYNEACLHDLGFTRQEVDRHVQVAIKGPGVETQWS